MLPQRDHLGRSIHGTNLGYPNRRVRQRSSHPLRRCHNLERIAHSRHTQEANVHIHARTRRRPQIPGRDAQPRCEVDDGGGHGAVETAAGVEVDGREFQVGGDGAGCLDREEDDVGEEELVDWAGGCEPVDERLDVGCADFSGDGAGSSCGVCHGCRGVSCGLLPNDRA